MNLADAGMRVRIQGIDQQCGDELRECLVGAILLQKRTGQVLVPDRIVRACVDRTRERRDGTGNVGCVPGQSTNRYIEPTSSGDRARSSELELSARVCDSVSAPT